MSLMKNFPTVVLWFLLVAAIISGILWVGNRSTGTTDSIALLPGGTAIIFECTDLPALVSELQQKNEMWKELSSSGIIVEEAVSLSTLDSLIKQNAQIREYLGKRITIAVSLKTNKTAGVIYCLPKSVGNQEKQLLKFLSGSLKEFQYNKRRYEGSSIYDLSWKDTSGLRNFSFVTLKGVIIGSFAPELVEEVVKPINPEEKSTRLAEFTKIQKTIGEKVPLNIFVNYGKAEGIFRSILDPKHSNQFVGLLNFASWGTFDVDVLTDKLVMNGFTSFNDSLSQELKLFYKQEPIGFGCPAFLPEAVGFFKVYGFSDKELYFEQLSGFLQNDPGSKELIARKNSLLKDFGIDLDKGFSEMISDEYGYAAMQSGRALNPFFFMELKSQSLAEQQFVDWMRVWAQKNGRNPSELMMDYKIDNNNTLTVYKLPLGGIPSMVFGSRFKSPGNDYFTFINNYLVFASSYNSIKEFIYKVVLGNTLASGPSYTSVGENISSRSNLYLYAKPAVLVEGSEEMISEPIRDVLSKGKESLSKFTSVSLQYSAADELLYNHLFINFSKDFSGTVNTVWKSRIDSTTAFKPAIVVNHLTGEKEIIIQDQMNQIYLLSNAGLILWKQMLDGPLLSEVYQVDYYKNGKFQFLFSTRDRIYLLDRNGNPVEKYPVELRSPATAGISVFDYDKDGSIRICVPGEDRKIYMYDKDGKVIPGWQPKPTDNRVLQPVQHFRVGSKDYIVAIDRFKFYILDRKGSNRVAVKQYFQVSANNGFYLDVSRGDQLARLVTTDTSGNIMRVYFSGKVEKIHDRRIDPGHYFIFADLDGDQKGEYLTVFDSTLHVLNPFMEESFRLEFGEAISFRPIVYKFSSKDNKIGIVLRSSGNIYLYNNNGTLYNGFPLEGSAPFSISSFPELNGRFNMIVGTRNNFLYNYSVQ